MERAVILLSGGIDSSTTLAIAGNDGFELYAMTIDYGQRHRIELEAAKRIADQVGVREHRIINLDIASFTRSALTGDEDVPKGGDAGLTLNAIPVTYVPARNTIFLSLALGWAETLKARHIFIGVNSVDYSGYPDCRLEFIESFEKMANLATKEGIEGRRFKIEVPLIWLKKPEIIRKGIDLGLDYSLTHSCYDPSDDGKACGECESCIIRSNGFREAGVQDPTIYT